ncbi:MAG: M42 family peptidase [Candidatus Altiarchaeales archaeon]|nr:MAG: M42 family peptidase [Candidatus Altiarchaeales archaeon]RLI94109.1 MAG: M42 family peptidase [Candidatus Altiarchaeales archaeon]HDO82387.1 M42 family peptidase [Candidatus Altiarchaeales archaeon]HEX55036.1 M42 family peptidase [Candidatus Altiarchaeales archaeon]
MELLRELCNAHAVSGFEDEVREIMRREFEKSCDSVEIDSFGNVIATKGDGEKGIMLAAHMDEIGFMVKFINEKGFINFIKIGGIDDRLLINQRVVIRSKSGKIPGVIGSKPPHLQKEEEKKKIIRHDELFIDIGARNKKDAEKIVEVGDPIVFEPNFQKLNDKIFYGKAIDDRLGCYVLLRVMERIPSDIPIKIFAVGTTQEEVGLKGARVAAFRINPDCAFAIDTTIAGDTPMIKETESRLKIGNGPAITITEASGRGVVTHPKLREFMIRTAKRYKIPYQVDVLEGGMTDGAIIYLTREGVPTGVISIPCRYIHSPTGIFSIDDVNNAIKLLEKTIMDLNMEMNGLR